MSIYYISEIIDSRNFTALNKARNDVEHIFKLKGYTKLHSYTNILTSKQADIRFIREMFNIFFLLKENDSIYFQYPYYERRNKMRRLINVLVKKKNVNLVAIIHDIDSLRYERGDRSISREIRYLNKFNYLISHNPKMTAWLKKNGCNTNIIDLNLFDYIIDKPLESYNHRESDLVFAGNLDIDKSKFIYELIQREDFKIKFNLYGPNFKGSIGNANIRYNGIFKPDELLNKLEGKYGLIWDGNDLDKCSGHIGKYTKYNNPHKLSMYIAAKIPVICWDKMAISGFIKNNNIGITINSLNELEYRLASVTEEEYDVMLNNIKKINHKVVKGEFMREALTTIDNMIELVK